VAGALAAPLAPTNARAQASKSVKAVATPPLLMAFDMLY
jgi:hypothetical protein